MKVSERDFSGEIIFKASRSSGKGGQNVNKVSTKVELSFDVAHSFILSSEEKSKLLSKLPNRITNDGLLRIVSQTERSQFQNKQIAVRRFYDLLEKCFQPEKKRVATQPSRSSKLQRLKTKKIKSEKKILRRKKMDWE